MSINEPILPERAREILRDLCTNVAGLAKAVHDLGAYGYTVANIQDMVETSMSMMDVPEAHKAAAVQAYNEWAASHDRNHSEEEPPVGSRKAVAAILGDQKSVECAVMFRSGANFQGMLSESEWGGLRMLSPSPGGNTVEQFFDYEDVCVVARAVPAGESEQSRIVRS